MIVPVAITTPDGVERSLRFTLGARKRIARDLGRPFASVMETLTDDELPILIYHCLFDEDGNPPAGTSIAKLEECYEPADCKGLLAEVFEAMSQGAVKKNDALKMIEMAQQEQIQKLIQKSTGSTSGPSPVSISESPDLPRRARLPRGNSGTSRRKNTPPSVLPMTNDASSPVPTQP